MATQARRLRTAPAAKRGTQVREEEGRGSVRSEAKDRDGPYHSEQREETILSRRFQEGEHPAFVKVGAGLTLPLGAQFEMLRLDVSVSLPCLPDEIDDTYAIASDWVADRVAEEETIWLGRSQKAPAKRGK